MKNSTIHRKSLTSICLIVLMGLLYNCSSSNRKKSIYTLDRIDFKRNEAILLESSYETLDEVYNLLQAHPNTKFLIEGHTDNRGTIEEQEKITLERANAVKNYLVKKGIKQERLRTKGRGSSDPLASNWYSWGRAKNKRIEFYRLKDLYHDKSLISAISDGNIDSVEQILKKGVNPDSGKGGVSPIILATKLNNSSIVELLIKYGANIEVKEKMGLNSLALASLHGFTKIVSLLLQNNSSHTIEIDSVIYSVMDFAIARDNIELKEMSEDYKIPPIFYKKDQTKRPIKSVLLVSKANMHLIRKIYNEHLEIRPNFEGKIDVIFEILPSGKVASATISGSTTKFPDFDNKVLNQLTDWKFFPINKMNNDTLNIPFTFHE